MELIVRLEELVGRLLSERADLLDRNALLAAECEKLALDRGRVHDELGKLLAKLDTLAGGDR